MCGATPSEREGPVTQEDGMGAAFEAAKARPCLARACERTRPASLRSRREIRGKADDGLLFELRLGGGTFSLPLHAFLRLQLLALAFGLLSLALGERYLRSTQS